MAAWDSGLTDAVLAASAAASDSTRWSGVLAILSERFGATAAALHTPHPAPAERTLFADFGLHPDSLATYVEHWVNQDPWFAGATAKKLPAHSGYCAIGRELCDWPELDRLDFYQEFARPSGVRGLMTLLVDDGVRSAEAPLTAISLYRRPGLEEFSHDDRRAFATVHAPLQLALHAHWSLHRTRQGVRIATDVLAAMPKPLFVLAGDGAILHANPRGAALLERDGWMGTKAGRVVRLGQLGADALTSLLHGAVRGVVQTQALWVAARALGGGPSSVACATGRFVPLTEDNACRSAWPCARVLLLIDESEPDQHAHRLSALVMRHGLTQAEARLLEQLAEGMSPSEIASANEVSIYTVRAHLRHLFEKTHTRRQSELVRLFVFDAGVVR